MLAKHFGFKSQPFSRDIPTEALLNSPPFTELYARLQYMVSTRAFGLVTGEIGAGKTTAIRALYDQLDQDKHPFTYIADSRLTPREFYRDVLSQFNLMPPYSHRELRREFEQTILNGYRNEGKQPVIVLDEAHLLKAQMLQEVRFILNFHMDSASPMTFILVGQTELRGSLRLRAFEAVTQRVQVRYHLTGMDPAGVSAYIANQMRFAGASRPIFAEQAINAIAALSHGLPRMINNLATACLLDACSRNQQLVDEGTVQRAAAEFRDVNQSQVGMSW